MGIEKVHSFLVHPAKHAEEQPDVSGANIPLKGSLFNMLKGVFERANVECNIEIVFRPDENGNQVNVCRDSLVKYVAQPTLTNGRDVARRLQKVTTHRSGLGLLFLIRGSSGSDQHLVISRFPADQGIIAQEEAASLSVQFIERVFMKSAKAYKSAHYVSDSLEGGFWVGSAVDRQISSARRDLSEYWIREFLESELRTTGAAGTKRLAVALRDSIRSSEGLSVRQELIAAASLLRGQDGKPVTGRGIVHKLGLSKPAVEALEKALPRSDLMDETFLFDREEFERHAPYRAVELDNGGMLIAEDAHFKEIFVEELVNENVGTRRYTTEGCIVDERLRKHR